MADKKAQRGISAAMASSIPAAASGGLDVVSTRCFPSRRCLFQTYGTKMAEAVAPVSFTASLTVANTGRSKCVDPAFLGFVPPTTWVPCMYEHMLFDQGLLGIFGVTVCDSLLGMETSQHQLRQSKSKSTKQDLEGALTFPVYQ